MIKLKKPLNFIYFFLGVILILLFSSCTAIGLLGGAITNNFIPDSIKISENEFLTLERGTDCNIKLVNNNNLAGSFDCLRYIPNTSPQNNNDLGRMANFYLERGDSITLKLKKIKDYKGIFLGLEPNYLNISRFDKKRRVLIENILSMKFDDTKIITGEEIRKYNSQVNLSKMDYYLVINYQNNTLELTKSEIEYLQIKREKYYHWIGAGVGFIIDILIITEAVKFGSDEKFINPTPPPQP